MIKSMTGFGKAECIIKDKKVTIELKSVNSKQLDLNVKLPYLIKDKEVEVKQLLSAVLERGKIDCYVSTERQETESATKNFDDIFILNSFKELKKITKSLKLSDEEIFSQVMRLPDATKKTEAEVVTEKDLKSFMAAMKKAITAFNEFREQEGKALEKDILARINNISKGLKAIEKYDQPRIEKIKQRIKDNLTEVIEVNKIDNNRFEQELIYYIEKLDVTEEKVRLKNHCDYFLETAKKENNSGRKLAFISQEIGREINTIGSKANNSEMQKIVVEMKDELEKVKEQINNVL